MLASLLFRIEAKSLHTRYPEKLDSPGLSRHNVKDDTAKDKIDDTSHQDRSQDDQAELNDIDRSLRYVPRARNPRAVTDGLHWLILCQHEGVGQRRNLTYCRYRSP